MSLKATVITDTRDSSVPFLCWRLIAFIAARSGTEFEEIDGTRSARRFDTRDTFDLVKRASCKLIRKRERERVKLDNISIVEGCIIFQTNVIIKRFEYISIGYDRKATVEGSKH